MCRNNAIALFLIYTLIMFTPFVNDTGNNLYAQSKSTNFISGNVIDENGFGLPFTTIYIENTTNGTTSNVNGEFTLEAENGLQRVVFQFVGYKTKILEIDNRSGNHPLTVILKTETLNLSELVISADDEDPAYKVIREAINARKYFKEEINAFECRAYLKGLQAITQKPEKILGIKVPLDSGIVYLSESVSNLYYQRPDKVKEEMISSKVSGNNNAFSYNIASDVLFNPYKNIFEYESISERGFISPIATNALLFYDYELAGTIIENDRIINKIRLIPKRQNDPVFTGYIYIIEDEWRIHSVDLMLTKANQIEFIDSVKINQVYTPVPGKNVWTLLSQRFEFTLEAFGFKGYGYFVGVYSRYKVEPNYRAIEKKLKINIPKREQLTLFPDSKKFFNNEILKINDEANKRDSSYWETIRPVPLTKLEKNDYVKGDSLNTIKESKSYKDSIDKISNSIELANLFITGYVHSNSYKRRYFRFQPLTSILLYNTVEGPVVNLQMTYSKRNKNGIDHQIIPTIRYSFEAQKLTGHLRGYYHTNLKKFERLGIDGGKKITQLYEDGAIRPVSNTTQTLIFRRNYIKLFEKTYIKPSYRREIINGLLLRTSLEYVRRTPLKNTSFFSFFRDARERPFTTNNPKTLANINTEFQRHTALISNISLRYRINQKFISRPGRKIIMSASSPEITWTYRKGINLLGSSVNYDWMELAFSNSSSLGLFGNAIYNFKVGKFINKQKLYFTDFHHSHGNRTTVTQFGSDISQLLGYYDLSTDSQKLEFHYEHHFNGFLINKIPGIRKSKIQTVFSFNYIDTPEIQNYFEFGLSLEHIFKIARVGYYTAILGGNNYGGGMRIGIGF